jgi:hypothetical protein
MLPLKDLFINSKIEFNYCLDELKVFNLIPTEHRPSYFWVNLGKKKGIYLKI